ncbi:MAG: hypothetical protein WCC10_18290 [Tumebacillaceae bacterium]
MKRSVWKTFGVLMAVCAMLVTALGVSAVGNTNRTEDRMISFGEPREPYAQTASVTSSDPRDPYTAPSLVTLGDPRDPYTRQIV